MTHPTLPGALAAVLALSVCGAPALAKPKTPATIPFVDDAKAPADAAPRKAAAAGVPLLPGSGSKEPVNITADKLDFLNKDNKLIYTGNVVVVQGESTLKASKLNIDLQKDAPGAGGATAPATPAPSDGAPGQGSSVRHMDADGPVTLISKDQVGTGDRATYDKLENKVYLFGNVTLSQGTNVTQGDRLIYDMTSGQAQVFSGKTNNGRVSSVFTPGTGTPGGPPKAAPSPAKAVPAKATPGKAASRGKTTAKHPADPVTHDADAAQ